MFGFLCLHPAHNLELPPPPQRAYFGRSELIEKVVGFAEDLKPVTLIGVGGSKTSIALMVLRHERIKHRFVNNRGFTHCDRFQPARPRLSRLSETIGAGMKTQRICLLYGHSCPQEMILLFDNAESILNPQKADARDTYAVVEELRPWIQPTAQGIHS